MIRPRINLMYYKNILDICMPRFFLEHNSEFEKDQDGRYVFSSSISESTLKKIFKVYVKDELGKLVCEYRDSMPEFFFIIGSCCPGENLLLEIGVDSPKLKRLVESNPDLKYFLGEADIQLDMRMFNSVFDDVFLEYMNERRKTWKNVFFIRHKKIDCYVMYKFLKRRFGTMTVNLWKRLCVLGESGGNRSVMISVNDHIDENCPSLDTLLDCGPFRIVENEVNHYVDLCMNGDF